MNKAFRWKRWSKRTVAAAVGILLLIGAADVTLSKAVYSPFEDSTINQETFCRMARLMIPEASWGYAMSYTPGSPCHFSRYRQNFRLMQESSRTNINHAYFITGTFHYFLGRATVSYDPKPSVPFVFPQSYFRYQPDIAAVPLPETDCDYRAAIGFAQNMDLKKATAFAKALFPSRNDGRVVRFIIETTAEDEQTALGIEGDASYFNRVNTMTVSTHTMAMYLKNDLRWLQQHKTPFEKMMESGLFGEKPVDPEARLAYLDAHGVQCMGAVVFLRGDILSELLQDDRIMVREITPDAAC